MSKGRSTVLIITALGSWEIPAARGMYKNKFIQIHEKSYLFTWMHANSYKFIFIHLNSYAFR
jgi:hypothetical protein